MVGSYTGREAMLHRSLSHHQLLPSLNVISCERVLQPCTRRGHGRVSTRLPGAASRRCQPQLRAASHLHALPTHCDALLRAVEHANRSVTEDDGVAHHSAVGHGTNRPPGGAGPAAQLPDTKGREGKGEGAVSAWRGLAEQQGWPAALSAAAAGPLPAGQAAQVWPLASWRARRWLALTSITCASLEAGVSSLAQSLEVPPAARNSSLFQGGNMGSAVPAPAARAERRRCAEGEGGSSGGGEVLCPRRSPPQSLPAALPHRSAGSSRAPQAAARTRKPWSTCWLPPNCTSTAGWKGGVGCRRGDRPGQRTAREGWPATAGGRPRRPGQARQPRHAALCRCAEPLGGALPAARTSSEPAETARPPSGVTTTKG